MKSNDSNDFITQQSMQEYETQAWSRFGRRSDETLRSAGAHKRRDFDFRGDVFQTNVELSAKAQLAVALVFTVIVAAAGYVVLT